MNIYFKLQLKNSRALENGAFGRQRFDFHKTVKHLTFQMLLKTLMKRTGLMKKKEIKRQQLDLYTLIFNAYMRDVFDNVVILSSLINITSCQVYIMCHVCVIKKGFTSSTCTLY